MGEEMFLILTGKVGIYKADVRFAKLGSGGHFGEMAIMDKRPRSANAKAESKSKLIAVSRRRLFALMRQDSAIAVKLLWCFVQVLNRRLRSTNQALLEANLSQAMGHPIPDLSEFTSPD
jgi:CRP-like cAMP-binding protein